MKKIPTLFPREFKGHKIVSIGHDPIPGMEWVLMGEGTPTEKVDGACCAIIDGLFYKRYDAKLGKDGSHKRPPLDAIPCDDPDPITGHWPFWVKVSETNPDDKWFWEAYRNSTETIAYHMNGTYEAIGRHFNGNPYHLTNDILVKHGAGIIDLPDRSFEGIREYLKNHFSEGIVFWKDGEPKCKIKRTDFGFKWPIVDYEIKEERNCNKGKVDTV